MNAQPSESNAELFEPGAAPAPGGAVIALFLVAAIMVFGGFYGMGIAFSVPVPWHWIFFPSLLLTVAGFGVAFRSPSDR